MKSVLNSDSENVFMGFERLIVKEPAEWVIEISLNRPRQRNALDQQLRTELFDALTLAEQGSYRVIILSAQGEIFCAGGDLKEMAATTLEVPPKDYVPVRGRNIDISKPIVGAINGPAIAGGFLIAQMCDMVVAAKEASFSISEVKHGRGAPWAAPLSRIMPRRVVNELLLTGEPVSAERAYQIGFVNRVVKRENLETAALELAERIAANAPLSVRGSLQVAGLGDAMSVRAAQDVADLIFEPIYRSGDAKEGPLAFREGRAPRWQGS